MLKKIVSNDVYYSISWSRVIEYEKYSATRIIPELSGIVRLMHKRNNRYVDVLLYACWRDGCPCAAIAGTGGTIFPIRTGWAGC